MKEPERISWTWRHAIAQSGLQATTKHVLLTISLYMNEMGKGCYPTQEDLAKATSLTERAVRKHIDIAEKEGWIIRREHGFRGQKWRNHEYEPRWPDRQDVEDETLHVEKGAEPHSARACKGEAPRSGPSAKGAEPRSGKVRNHVPPNVPEPSNTSLRSERARDRFEDFEKAYPKPMGSDRSRAKRTFGKLSDPDQLKAISAAQRLGSERETDRLARGESRERSQRYTPNASRWLDEGAWQDEPENQAAGPLVTIRADTPEFVLIERHRGRAIRVGMSRTITVTQSELEAARAAERQVA